MTLITLQSYAQNTTEAVNSKIIYLLGYQKQFSQHYIGWIASFKEIKDTLNVFTIPVVYSIGKSSLKKTSLEKNKLASLDNIAVGLGFNGYEQLVNGFFLNLGLGAKVGSENSRNLDNEKANHFFISGNTNIGFLWVPSKELGITIGSSLFGSLSNSKYVNIDWGVNVEIGINF
jgi:hypothetical protein